MKKKFYKNNCTSVDNGSNKSLILGTAQIINDYGITNKNKKNNIQALTVLKNAKDMGIYTYDTSKIYLKAHKVLESFITKDFNKYTIIEKISSAHAALYNKNNKAVHWDWLNGFNDSGGNICLMLHNGADYLDENCRKDLQDCKKKKLVSFIGISVYDPDILNKCLELGGFDIVQYPLSLADRRFCEPKLLKKIKNQNISVHARSIFLQGLLISEPVKKFSFLREYKKIYHDYDRLFPSQKKKIFLAIKSVLDDIKASIVVGVEDSEQLQTINEMFHSEQKSFMNDLCKSRKLWASLSKKSLDPRKW